MKLNRVLKEIYCGLGLIITSIFIHEGVHLVQEGFKVKEVCFVGWQKTTSFLGWVTPYISPTRTERLNGEIMAYSISFLYLLIIGYMIYVRGKNIKR